MSSSEATTRTIARVVSDALAHAARDLPCFESGDRVWIKVRACERLIQRGLGPTVWREGVVIQGFENGRLHQVFLSCDSKLALLVGPSQIRINPPWNTDPARQGDGTKP